jgi:predicted metal-dependent hydrolase
MSTQQHDPRFQEAIELFNRQEFFACHDVLEDLWSETLGPERDFLQGLIHAAVALFHFSEGNLGGARKMHDSALRYLSDYGADYCDLDLTRLRSEFDHCFEPLLGAHDRYPAPIELDPVLIPRLHSPRA